MRRSAGECEWPRACERHYARYNYSYFHAPRRAFDGALDSRQTRSIDENCETPVLTQEAIEVHLDYLRSGLKAMQAALSDLRDRVDAVSEKASSRIEETNAKVGVIVESLGEKIDRANDLREASDARLSAKIDRLTK